MLKLFSFSVQTVMYTVKIEEGGDAPPFFFLSMINRRQLYVFSHQANSLYIVVFYFFHSCTSPPVRPLTT